MTLLTIQLTVTLESALSIGAGGSAGTIADKSIVRDGWDRPLIPGSQVKGKLRWAVEQLLRGMGDDIPAPFDERERVEQDKLKNETMGIDRTNFVRELFGSPEYRSPLHFADLPTTVVLAEQARSMHRQLSQIRPSVSINRRRGTAEDARLLFQETALEGMQFTHKRAIVGHLPDEAAEQYAALLWAGLKLTDRWGGAKSRGLGWSNVQATFTLSRELTETHLADALRLVLAPEGGSA